MMTKKVWVNDSDEEEEDVEVQRRLQGFTLSMKQRADHLLMTSKFDEAVKLYRELLMHLTRSQVQMAAQKELVVSCRMNILAALSKLQQWREIPSECEHLLQFLRSINTKLPTATGDIDDVTATDTPILGRLYYFRGTAHARLGELRDADEYLRLALKLIPDNEAIRDEWKHVQSEMQGEHAVKQLLHTSRTHFQANNLPLAAESGEEALRSAQALHRDDLTGLLHGNLAMTYSRMDKPSNAIAHFTAAIALARAMPSSASPQREERLFDLLDGLATTHLQLNELQKALTALNEASAVLPRCPGRKNREHAHFLNIGRVCFSLRLYDDAEDHFSRSDGAAMRDQDVGNALRALVWLGKVYAEQEEPDKLTELLERAMPMVKKHDGTHREHYDALGMLLLACVSLRVQQDLEQVTDEEINKVMDILTHFKTHQHFTGHLRAANLLVMIWQRDSKSHQSELEALVVDISDAIVGFHGTLQAVDASLLTSLVLLRVDMCVASIQLLKALGIVKHAVSCITLKADADANRCALLRRFAELYCMMSTEERAVIMDKDSDGTVKLLSSSLSYLRSDVTGATQRQVLSTVLFVLAHHEAQLGSDEHSARAEKMLAESIQQRRDYDEEQRVSKSDALGELLVALCVLHIKRGDLDHAQQIMREIESFPQSASWSQLVFIKDGLRQLQSKMAEHKPTRVCDEKKGTNKQESASSVTALGSMQALWIAVCIAFLAIAYAYLLPMMA